MAASRLLYSFALLGSHLTPTRATQLSASARSSLLAIRASSGGSAASSSAASSGARAVGPTASAATATATDAKRFITGETGNNVTPYIANLIGRDLHKQQAHPLGIIKARIEEYFASLPGAEFEIADSLDPLVNGQECFHNPLPPATPPLPPPTPP